MMVFAFAPKPLNDSARTLVATAFDLQPDPVPAEAMIRKFTCHEDVAR